MLRGTIQDRAPLSRAHCRSNVRGSTATKTGANVGFMSPRPHLLNSMKELDHGEGHHVGASSDDTTQLNQTLGMNEERFDLMCYGLSPKFKQADPLL